ncbi:phosphatidate cytidylyltransferase [Corynebacterium sp. ES2794-CONJ1]|uniref:phosphatidate cytidylyltransferase n=1 Tax=unclassified Corynebacterium TaxID=2624378 RepID=UPI0021677024|nr:MULTISPECIES: phosphatidate cytidylyltransferase [unclassified Corynebacterium]MCS4489097.1 phosphatidate cytidylyltransferase [Corynebacterium sp. ES2775-CONJ]MCS4490910.1 phosphatidate cytidylyltransferase [Corynebacterium sp. ES2715-CONJ3]MCS4531208.1 phosphatidate cytidylyltransferase [Corynebacterium sp. ES2730-CONJ]MCU9518576.1 phosphatidate cytidylyltransferase [Corynebacterium sp. ES2794-CONJ1]
MPSTPRRLPRPRNSAGRDLKQAILIGVALFVLAALAMFSGPHGWYLFVSIAISIAMWEVMSRLNEKGYIVQRWWLQIGGQLMLWLSLFFGPKGLVSGFVTAVLLLMFSRLFHHGRHAPPQNYLRDTAMGIFVLTWVPLFGSFAAMMSLLEGDGGISGTMFIATFALCVIASDTGGYIVGVLIGSHPMAPAVSPKKSWEGFAGSVIFGVATGAMSVHFLLGYEWFWGIALGIGLVICATLGDLVESQFKRELGIKDMSDLLPGHGGVMDRFDGMLPAAMVTWLVLSFIAS